MIVIPALHPSHEVIASVDHLRVGDVQRTSRVVAGIGGKAINVARFAAAMSAEIRLIVLGDERLLAAVAGDEVLGARTASIAAIPSSVPSRTDVAIVEGSGSVTVLNDTAADPGTARIDAVVEATLAALRPGDVLVLAGTTPNGTAGILRRLTLAGAERGARVIVDASGSWLREALEGQPYAVKVNAAEAAEAAEHGPIRGPEIVAVTDGPAGIRAWIGTGAPVRVVPPAGIRVVNPLGAGDAVTAGLAIALDRGQPAIEGLVLGTAMAAARLGHLELALRPADVERLRAGVRVVPEPHAT
jgi:fructose-1-phosphate kinase PfkB-like protein